ncbi:MAG: Uma2 family endonuclease [Chloroflexota bacterium]|nr:Uma2 family endonuclease [Chloroflexota bacterium]
MTVDTRLPRMRMALAEEITDIDLAALQGSWSVEQYLRLTDQTNRLIEYSDGRIDVLPTPAENHQAVLEGLFLALRAFIKPLGGKVRFAPLRLMVRDGKFREPDILLLQDAGDPRRQNRNWLGADLVVEVVSEDNPERDIITKRTDYAQAGILEYWIVNPLNETLTVLELRGETYVERGIFSRGQYAASKLLEGFGVSVDEVFDAI